MSVKSTFQWESTLGLPVPQEITGILYQIFCLCFLEERKKRGKDKSLLLFLLASFKQQKRGWNFKISGKKYFPLHFSPLLVFVFFCFCIFVFFVFLSKNIMKTLKTNSSLKQKFCSIFAVYLGKKDKQLIAEFGCFGTIIRYQTAGKSQVGHGWQTLQRLLDSEHPYSLTLDQAAFKISLSVIADLAKNTSGEHILDSHHTLDQKHL